MSAPRSDPIPSACSFWQRQRTPPRHHRNHAGRAKQGDFTSCANENCSGRPLTRSSRRRLRAPAACSNGNAAARRTAPRKAFLSRLPLAADHCLLRWKPPGWSIKTKARAPEFCNLWAVGAGIGRAAHQKLIGPVAALRFSTDVAASKRIGDNHH